MSKYLSILKIRKNTSLNSTDIEEEEFWKMEKFVNRKEGEAQGCATLSCYYVENP